MNGKKAKRLRREVFGDLSPRHRELEDVGGTAVDTGVRGAYQGLKRSSLESPLRDRVRRELEKAREVRVQLPGAARVPGL